MKKTTFTLLLFLSCCWLAAQCPTDITFSRQGQIDSFPINYPGCTQIFGKVTIAESDSASITHLDSLSRINYISDLNVYNNAALTSLSGLDNMDFSIIITGILIDNNPQLFLCHVKSICDYLENGGFATISSNAPGCNSMFQITFAVLKAF